MTVHSDPVIGNDDTLSVCSVWLVNPNINGMSMGFEGVINQLGNCR
jgi:hypothetical protein